MILGIASVQQGGGDHHIGKRDQVNPFTALAFELKTLLRKPRHQASTYTSEIFCVGLFKAIFFHLIEAFC